MLLAWDIAADLSPITCLLATADIDVAAEDGAARLPGGHRQDMTNTTLSWTTLLATLVASAPATTLQAQAAVAEDADDVHTSAAQSAVHGHELMLNGFRAPSIGLEYRVGMISLHGGAYPTIINDEGLRGTEGTTWFAKAGLTLWFLPLPIMGDERSSFYAGASYLNDFAANGWGHSAQVETGFRWVFFQGLFLRLGASALYAPGRTCTTGDCSTLKVRPNPGLGWAIAF